MPTRSRVATYIQHSFTKKNYKKNRAILFATHVVEFAEAVDKVRRTVLPRRLGHRRPDSCHKKTRGNYYIGYQFTSLRDLRLLILSVMLISVNNNHHDHHDHHNNNTTMAIIMMIIIIIK